MDWGARVVRPAGRLPGDEGHFGEGIRQQLINGDGHQQEEEEDFETCGRGGWRTVYVAVGGPNPRASNDRLRYEPPRHKQTGLATDPTFPEKTSATGGQSHSWPDPKKRTMT